MDMNGLSRFRLGGDPQNIPDPVPVLVARSHSSSYTLLIPSFKINHLSIFKMGMSIVEATKSAGQLSSASHIFLMDLLIHKEIQKEIH